MISFVVLSILYFALKNVILRCGLQASSVHRTEEGPVLQLSYVNSGGGAVTTLSVQVQADLAAKFTWKLPLDALWGVSKKTPKHLINKYVQDIGPDLSETLVL